MASKREIRVKLDIDVADLVEEIARRKRSSISDVIGDSLRRELLDKPRLAALIASLEDRTGQFAAIERSLGIIADFVVDQASASGAA